MIIEEGVYGDGSFGLVHVYERVFETAYELGWNPKEKEMELIKLYPFDTSDLNADQLEEYNETINEIVDESIEYLNCNHRDTDHIWEFRDGDFGYFLLEPEEEGVY